MRNYQVVSGVALSVSAVTTIGFLMLASMSEFSVAHVVFILWALSPYSLILVMMFAMKSRGSQLALDISICIASLILFVFSLVFYAGVVFNPTSSTGGLVFLFGPCYQLVGGPLIVGLCFIVGRLFLPQVHHSDENPLCRKCGYNLTGNMSGRCPECGQPISGGPFN